MKKLITILLSFLFISFHTAKADVAIGITGAVHMLDADGTETTRQSNQKNTGSSSEDTVVPELFIETTQDGITLGLSYIPTRSMGSESRKDTSTSGDGQDTGTYKAEAELDNVFQVYLDLPITEIGGFPMHGKLGIQHATIATLESLNSGSTYPDEDVLGLTLGLGTKGDLAFGNNMFYKAEATYTKFDDYKSDSSAGNKVEAEIEDVALKFSVGYKF